MAKVGLALTQAQTGEAKVGEDAEMHELEVKGDVVGQAVKPQAFKSLIGKDHPEFSTARQQARHLNPLPLATKEQKVSFVRSKQHAFRTDKIGRGS